MASPWTLLGRQIPDVMSEDPSMGMEDISAPARGPASLDEVKALQDQAALQKGIIVKPKAKFSENKYVSTASPAVIQPQDLELLIRNREKYLNGDPESGLPGDPDYQALKKGLADREATLKQFEGLPQETNYSGLFGALDYFGGGGTNFEKNYKAPLTAEERLGLKLKMQDSIQSDREKMMQLKDKLLEKFMNSTGYTSQTRQITDQGFDTQPPPQPKAGADKSVQNFDKLVKVMRSDPEFKDLWQAVKSADDSINLLNQGTAFSDAGVITKIVRTMGDNRISNADKEAIKSVGGLGTKFDQIWESMSTGKMVDVNRQDAIKMLKAIKAVKGPQISEKIRDYTDGGVGYDLSPVMIDKAARMAYGGSRVKEAKNPSPPEYDGSKPLPANATVEMKILRRDYLKRTLGK